MLYISQLRSFFHLDLRLAGYTAMLRHSAPMLSSLIATFTLTITAFHLTHSIESMLSNLYLIKILVSESIASPYLRTMVLRLIRNRFAASA